MADKPAAEAAEKAGENRRVALLIAALALALALTEVAGDDAKTEAQLRNVESANLWAFFQARTIRQTVLGAEADRAALDAVQADDPAAREGRRELAEQARAEAMHEDGRFDAASAAIQVGIVLASAAIITGTATLAWVGGALDLGGALLSALTYAGLL